jgi:2-polyprenyl-6-methoxyphenol hydroxylase-like FAD-dependent oxidoreductase
MKTDVVIIGAGPTGLMLANQLNRFGINFWIADNKLCPTEQSRALAVSARSMELYQQLGLSDTVLAQSTDVVGFKIFMEGKSRADISLKGLGKGLSDFENFMNAFEQNKNEKLLSENLVEHQHRINWGCEFTDYVEVDGVIMVKLKNRVTNEELIVETKYLVGCEGARSPVRHKMGLEFVGGTYENKFFVADTVLDWSFGYDKVILMPTPFVFITFFPLKGDKRMRVIGTLPREFEDKKVIDFEALEKVIRASTKLELDFKEVSWHSVYKLHHRCVNAFNKGNVFLAGDSAHIHSPAGGQGMNTGLQDAHNLAWKLAFVLKGAAKSKLLDTYNEERLPFARALLNSTDKGFTFLAGDGFWVRNIRKYFMIPLISNLLKVSRFRTFAFKKIAQVAYSYKGYSLSRSDSKQSLKFKAGDRIPYICLGYYNNFKAPVFHLIRVSDVPIAKIEREEIDTIFPFEVKIIENNISGAWRALGVTKTLYILVRPDQHILYVADELRTIEVNKHLGTYFEA